MSHSEIELKFLVPSTARTALAKEMGRSSSSFEQLSLAAVYLDMPDGRLAKAGIAWRLRREGRKWVQATKAPGPYAGSLRT